MNNFRHGRRYMHQLDAQSFGPQPNGGTGSTEVAKAGVFVDDSDFTLYVGDVLEVLAELPDESVHCVVTSPPYWGLRDYGATGQLGLEATPDEFVQNMVRVFREVRRVLRADGTCWVNLGDSYASSPPGNTTPRDERPRSDRFNAMGAAASADRMTRTTSTVAPGLKPKDLVGIPWRVAFALQADGWYLRSDIIWAKPNPMPESVTDRPTKAHEYVFLLTKSPRYFFDAVAVREPVSPFSDFARVGGAIGATTLQGEPGDPAIAPPKRVTPYGAVSGKAEGLGNGSRGDPSGRNVRSVWEIATQPYPEAHFATFPEALPERCIKAGTSERGCCPECGAPWEREVERAAMQIDRSGVSPYGHHSTRASGRMVSPPTSTTTGWRSTCECGTCPNCQPNWEPCPHTFEPVPCTVLDPFMGSGTTAHVARRLGRRSIGIELNPEYAALCARRLQQLSLFASTPEPTAAPTPECHITGQERLIPVETATGEEQL